MSDPSPNGTNGILVRALARGCGVVKSAVIIMQDPADPFRDMWEFTNPRITALWTVAVMSTCSQDLNAVYDKALGVYSTTLLTYPIALYPMDRPGDPRHPERDEFVVGQPPGYGEPECDLYRSLEKHFFERDGVDCGIRVYDDDIDTQVNEENANPPQWLHGDPCADSFVPDDTSPPVAWPESNCVEYVHDALEGVAPETIPDEIIAVDSRFDGAGEPPADATPSDSTEPDLPAEPAEPASNAAAAATQTSREEEPADSGETSAVDEPAEEVTALDAVDEAAPAESVEGPAAPDTDAAPVED